MSSSSSTASSSTATLQAWSHHQRSLLTLEASGERDSLQSTLQNCSAAECEELGVSLLHVQVTEARTALYGRTVLRCEHRRGRRLTAHGFRSGDEVSMRIVMKGLDGGDEPAQQQEQQQQHVSLRGVVHRVGEMYVECVVDEDGSNSGGKRSGGGGGDAEAMYLLMTNGLIGREVRIDMLASEATHRKMMQAVEAVQQVVAGRGGEGAAEEAERLACVLLDDAEHAGTVPEAVRRGGSLPYQRIQPLNPGLNDAQIDAISFALASPDVSLIHGPPGTGKTTAVVELILQAVMQDMRVLVCAPSNVAVDNILERVVNNKFTTPGGGAGGGAASASGAGSGAAATGHRGRKASARALNKPRVVRIGHPVRISEQLMQYSLEHVVLTHDGTEIVQDIRNDIQQVIEQFSKPMRQRRSELASERKRSSRRANAAASTSGGAGDDADGKPGRGGVSNSALRQQLRNLRKDARKREGEVINQILDTRNVVFATCVGAANRHLRDHTFDLVVIDEAAQAIEASCWIPLLRVGRCVLAGDHKQLPPTIKSEDAARAGLRRTLFERLMDAHGEAISRLLNVQYRMNTRICSWASEAMYGGLLVPHADVAEHTLLELPGFEPTNDRVSSVLVVVDTAGCNMQEQHARGGSHKNEGEADIVAIHVRDLVASGLHPKDIAVITPYNGQVELLRNLLRPDFPALEIRSVDGFQGGEREAVVMSLVRSNDERQVGFLSDDRRMNVAVTRARRHFALVCDSETCSRHAFLGTLIDHIETHGEMRSAMEFMVISEGSMLSLEPQTVVPSIAGAVVPSIAGVAGVAGVAAAGGGGTSFHLTPLETVVPSSAAVGTGPAADEADTAMSSAMMVLDSPTADAIERVDAPSDHDSGGKLSAQPSPGDSRYFPDSTEDQPSLPPPPGLAKPPQPQQPPANKEAPYWSWNTEAAAEAAVRLMQSLAVLARYHATVCATASSSNNLTALRAAHESVVARMLADAQCGDDTVSVISMVEEVTFSVAGRSASVSAQLPPQLTAHQRHHMHAACETLGVSGHRSTGHGKDRCLVLDMDMTDEDMRRVAAAAGGAASSSAASGGAEEEDRDDDDDDDDDGSHRCPITDLISEPSGSESEHEQAAEDEDEEDEVEDKASNPAGGVNDQDLEGQKNVLQDLHRARLERQRAREAEVEAKRKQEQATAGGGGGGKKGKGKNRKKKGKGKAKTSGGGSGIGGSAVGGGRAAQAKAAPALDPDATEEDLLAAAIAENDRLAHRHQYRITGTQAMPNPRKEHQRSALRQYLTQAERDRLGSARAEVAAEKASAAPRRKVARKPPGAKRTTVRKRS